jgi:hypothetical protein
LAATPSMPRRPGAAAQRVPSARAAAAGAARQSPSEAPLLSFGEAPPGAAPAPPTRAPVAPGRPIAAPQPPRQPTQQQQRLQPLDRNFFVPGWSGAGATYNAPPVEESDELPRGFIPPATPGMR